MSAAPDSFDLQLEWISDPSSTFPSANVFAVSHGTPGVEGVAEEVVLLVAQVRPPIIPPGTSRDDIERLLGGRSLPAVPFTGFSLTYSRLRELATLLTDAADTLDQHRRPRNENPHA